MFDQPCPNQHVREVIVLEHQRPALASPEPSARRMLTVRPIGSLWFGLTMLVVGALCGVAIQPLFASAQSPAATVTGQATSSADVTSSQPAPTQDNSPRGAMMRGVVSQTRHFLGDENAPVTIVEFCDFEVPECGQFADQVQSQLQQAYIVTSKVRSGYWPMATVDEGSQLAAEAAECAAEQDAFWNFHQAVYTDEAVSTLNFDKADLNAYAAKLGFSLKIRSRA